MENVEIGDKVQKVQRGIKHREIGIIIALNENRQAFVHFDQGLPTAKLELLYIEELVLYE
jgi:hypothetical protein